MRLSGANRAHCSVDVEFCRLVLADAIPIAVRRDARDSEGNENGITGFPALGSDPG